MIPLNNNTKAVDNEASLLEGLQKRVGEAKKILKQRNESATLSKVDDLLTLAGGGEAEVIKHIKHSWNKVEAPPIGKAHYHLAFLYWAVIAAAGRFIQDSSCGSQDSSCGSNEEGLMLGKEAEKIQEQLDAWETPLYMDPGFRKDQEMCFRKDQERCEKLYSLFVQVKEKAREAQVTAIAHFVTMPKPMVDPRAAMPKPMVDPRAAIPKPMVDPGAKQYVPWANLNEGKEYLNPCYDFKGKQPAMPHGLSACGEKEKSSWKARKIDPKSADEKMCKNAKKAFDEHLSQASKDRFYYAQGAMAREGGELGKPLICAYASHGAQGERSEMEDAHCIAENKRYLVAGVFDGHGGKKVSNYVSKQVQKYFLGKVDKMQGNVHQAFEEIIWEMQQIILEGKVKDGTTLVVSLIDKEKGIIYTATLGDSEGMIWRGSDTNKKAIPLSCVRNWDSKKDRDRVLELLKSHPDQGELQQENGSKTRLVARNGSINLSRSLGDKSLKRFLSPKPKITRQFLNPGDTVILACDGLMDYVPVRKLAEKMTGDIGKLPEKLVHIALNDDFRSKDNVTVLAIQVS